MAIIYEQRFDNSQSPGYVILSVGGIQTGKCNNKVRIFSSTIPNITTFYQYEILYQ